MQVMLYRIWACESLDALPGLGFSLSSGARAAVSPFLSCLGIPCEEGFIGTTGENTGRLRKALNSKVKMRFSRRDATPSGERCDGFTKVMPRFFGRVATVRVEVWISNIS
jgi:hypothetical protein